MSEGEKLAFRKQALELLELYASADEQRKFQRNVQSVSVPIELVCMWFDDFWHFGEELSASHEVQLRWKASMEKFCGCFSASEMTALNEFHQFFSTRAEALPCNDLEILLNTPAWKEIMAKARATLRAFK